MKFDHIIWYLFFYAHKKAYDFFVCSISTIREIMTKCFLEMSNTFPVIGLF